MLAHQPPAYPITAPTPAADSVGASLGGYREAWTAAVNLVAH
jgi:hypothetical protein